MIFIYSDVEPTAPAPGITRRVLARGGHMMAVEVSFEQGAVCEQHTHTQEQTCYIVSGSFVFEIDGEKTTVRQGDSCYFAPNAEHGVTALEPSVMLDIFTPQRTDFLGE